MNMNYAALIQNRKTVREFTGQHVSPAQMGEIERYFQEKALRLVPELETRLLTFGTEAREVLEGAAGYESFLVGAPAYMVLLSAEHERSSENAGCIMEDLILKLADMGLDSCWLTFTEGEHVKEVLEIVSTLSVAAVVAFGYGVKSTRRLRLNIRSMSNVDIQAKRRYHEPKRSVYDLAYLNTWGNSEGLDEHMGFYGDLLWEALYGASLAPSYLNRQAYGFVLHNEGVTLVRRPDAYTPETDARLSLGIALHHFTSIASLWTGGLTWNFGSAPASLALPEGYEAVASCKL